MTEATTVDNAYQFLYKISPDNDFKLSILTDVNLHKNSSPASQESALVVMERNLSAMWTKIREANSTAQYFLNYFKYIAWHHVIKGEIAEREKDAPSTINNFAIAKYFFELFEDRNTPIINKRLEIKFNEIGNSTSENNDLKKKITSLETKHAEKIKEIKSANVDLNEKLENLKSENADLKSENKGLKKTVVDIQAIEKEHLSLLNETLDEKDGLIEEIETLNKQINELKSQKVVMPEKPRQKQNLPGFVIKNLGDSNG
jgi:SMC interacting uncharacterized protein involved in chromosome segregation